eukprot:6488180-Amphidinium_carterae.1
MFWPEADTIDDVVAAGLWWSPGEECLYVRNDTLMQEDALGWVSGLLLDVWKLGTFSESRWLSLGHCSRQALLCQLTGFLNFLRWLRANNYVAEFDATGSSHVSEPVQQWVAFVSLCSLGPDAVLSRVLADDRLGKTGGECEMLYAEEHGCLDGLSSQFLPL